MLRKRKIRFYDFRKGEMSSVDPADLPKDKYGSHVALISALNADFSRKPGKTAKAYKPSAFDFNGMWPPENSLPADRKIISIGKLVYNQIWDGDEKVNRMRELVVIQVHGAWGFNWWELERTVGDNNWECHNEETPFHCDCNGEFTAPWKGDWGNTNAGQMSWLEYQGVLRGAAGAFINTIYGTALYNQSNSFPVWFGYVNRWPVNPAHGDVEGFFQIYDSADVNDGHCLKGLHGLWRGRTIPDYTPTFSVETESVNGEFYFNMFNWLGFNNSAQMRYCLIPLYDGYQIAALKAEPININTTVYSYAKFSYGTRIKITIPDFEEDDSFPERLSGFQLFRAKNEYGIVADPGVFAVGTAMGNYGLIGDIDIKTGIEGLWSAEGNIVQISGTTYQFQMAVETGITTPYEVPFSDHFLQVIDDNDILREYPITSANVNTDSNLALQFIAESATPDFDPDTIYNIKINARWKKNGDDVELSFADLNIMAGNPPPWLLVDKPVDEQPKIECNYGIAQTYKGRQYVADLTYDDIKEPLMWRKSPMQGETFSGFDIFPYSDILKSVKDDKLMNIGFDMDFLYFFTYYRIFKYLMGETLDQLHEEPWDIGLYAKHSLYFLNGIFHFIGHEKGYISYYQYDCVNRPKDFGYTDRNTLDNKILNQVAMYAEYCRAVPFLREHNLLMSFPIFQNLRQR